MFEEAARTANQNNLNDVVLFGLIGAFLTESTLNATFMRGLSASDVASLFSLPTMQKEELPQEHQHGGLASCLTMEKRGALADYADMIANTLYHAGAVLQENGHIDLSSLLEKENLEDNETSLELACRNLAAVIQSLDDRHFASVKKGNDELMIELPFLKNARRMVFSVFQKRHEHFKDANTSTEQVYTKLSEMLPAPSVRTVNSLLSLGILERRDDVGADEMKVGEDIAENQGDVTGKSNSSSAIGKEVSMRCAAMVACWRLSELIQQTAPGDMKVTPVQLSIFLDSLPTTGQDDVRDSVCASIEVFSPHETGQKW
mmetsp:Transcript_26866/g.45328  ORF Transcript_26866/g.45328 Transcript_26866/m.45328 type:complete len:317 (+) Transcript_26866:3-953(+)